MIRSSRIMTDFPIPGVTLDIQKEVQAPLLEMEPNMGE